MVTGSSPLARGLLSENYRPCGLRRIIPARAGFTHPFLWRSEVMGDHPRSRGVYTRWSTKSACGPGSSPLARGLLAPSKPERVRTGIIPARAGFTGLVPEWSRKVPDHPRSRGVYSELAAYAPKSSGSSPLARGLQPDILWGDNNPGIIPARAGFTVAHDGDACTIPDHPRSRGVYRPLVALEDSAVRIIPARAGFTAVSGLLTRLLSDHPRSRGVYPLRIML